MHDADLMDEKYGRPESEGLDAIVRGMQLTLADDHVLTHHTHILYEGLYKSSWDTSLRRAPSKRFTLRR